MGGDLYPLAILIGGLALLMVWVIRGRSVYVAAPLAALVVLIGSGSDPLAGMTGTYMGGFAEYMRRFLPVFLLGATFGKLMEDSGGAATLAGQIGQRLGTQRACLAVVIASAFLTYGGVSLFVVGFSVYPLAVRLFRGGNLPRRFIPATIAFGTITFTMTAAGSPAIQNLIPIPFLGTDARAGWSASLPAAVVMFVLGQGYLDWSIRRAVAAGERFEPRVGDVDEAVPAVSVAHQAGANGSGPPGPGPPSLRGALGSRGRSHGAGSWAAGAASPAPCSRSPWAHACGLVLAVVSRLLLPEVPSSPAWSARSVVPPPASEVCSWSPVCACR